MDLDLCSNLWRTTSEEERDLERLEKPIYNSVRQAAKVHSQVDLFNILNDHRLFFLLEYFNIFLDKFSG